MNSRPVRFVLTVFVFAVIAAVVGLGTYPVWKALVGISSSSDAKTEDSHAEPEMVKLSSQAIANLGLKTERLALVTKPYWRTIEVPAQVVERPGHCERLVTAPMAGVVKQIAAIKGDLVQPGDKLLTLQIVSEPLLTTQAALYKAQREMDIVTKEKNRLTEAFKSGAIPVAKMIEVENQFDRQKATLETLQHELGMRGLSKSDLQGVMQGKLLTEVTVVVPPPVPMPKGLGPMAVERGAPSMERKARNGEGEDHTGHGYEVEELKVFLGEMVQQGQTLCHLADHHMLFIEGKVFEADVPLIQRAAREGWPVRAELLQDPAGTWPSFEEPLRIRSIGSKVDPASQTLAFDMIVSNQHQEFQQGGKTYRLWRFRPGQRLRVHVPLEPFEGVFVVPAEAIVREGPEAYIFRERGEQFERKPVHVLFEDRQVAILANDGSVSPGNVIAVNRAVQLNWALKATAGGPPRHHHHEH